MQLSLVLTLLLAALFLKERITARVMVGAGVMLMGSIIVSGNK